MAIVLPGPSQPFIHHLLMQQYMTCTITGRVIHVDETEQQPKFRLSHGSCDLLKDVHVGDRVSITFDLTGKMVKMRDGRED